MRRIQRGATLLEAILAATIMGFVMAYVGTQALQYAERKVMNERAYKIVKKIRDYRNFMGSTKLKTSRAVSGKYYVMNFFWGLALEDGRYSRADKPEWGNYDRYYITENLSAMKLTSCTKDAGTINPYVIEHYFDCGDYDTLSTLKHEGVYIYLKTHKTIANPLVKSIPFAAESFYILTDNNEWDQMVQTAIRLPEIQLPDGFRIDVENIYFSLLGKSGSVAWIPDTTNYKYPVEDYINGNFTTFETFKRNVTGQTTGSKKPGIVVTIELSENLELLKSDGSVPLEKEAPLCWSDGTNNNLPCISALFDPTDSEKNAIFVQNDLKVDGELIYKDSSDNYRTPVIVKYNTFTSATQTINFITCPKDPAGVALEEKIALVPSSFSTGTETSTDFTNPGGIISRGTKGADGKHAFASGLSLEWSRSGNSWLVKGAIGFDAAFAEENGNQSVARNPKSISFISLQWCE